MLSDEGGRVFASRVGSEWMVFAPDEALLFSTNEAGARRFLDMPSIHSSPASTCNGTSFAPTSMTVSPSNACGQACLYCYGTPAHLSSRTINRDFCRAGAEFIASNSAAQGCCMQTVFHGVGEPTIHWRRFQECIECVDEAASLHGVRSHISLCTGGQLSQDQAEFIAAHVDYIAVSIDGPADIQCRQRPRRDGQDSYPPALNTARTALKAGRRVTIKSTITAATAPRMVEIVEFVASEIGRGVTLHLGELKGLPWTDSGIESPDVEVFLENYWMALDAGKRLGISVEHPDVMMETLAQRAGQMDTHMCLTPFDVVVAFYDVPHEGSSEPVAGAYGFYEPQTHSIRFDHDRRLAAQSAAWESQCGRCIVRNACGGRSGVKGKLPQDWQETEKSCSIRIAIAQDLLTRTIRYAPTASTGEKEVG